MRVTLTVVFCLTFLAACGDSTEDVLTRKGGGFPGLDGRATDSKRIEEMLKGSGTIELTDEMMERYVALVTAAKDVKTPSQALMARYKFDLPQWMALNALIWGSQSRVSMEQSRVSIEKALAEAKVRATDGTPQQQAAAAQAITMHEMQLKQMDALGAASDIDRKNVEVLKRWEPKLKALGRGK